MMGLETPTDVFVQVAREQTGVNAGSYTCFAFGDSAEMAQTLAALVLGGQKRATAGLLASYEADGEPLPQAGAFSVVLDGVGHPLALIQTREVRVVPFAEVDAAFAHDEGEGDRSLTFWRSAHRAFFERSGLDFTETSGVVCERFELIYPPPPLAPS